MLLWCLKLSNRSEMILLKGALVAGLNPVLFSRLLELCVTHQQVIYNSFKLDVAYNDILILIVTPSFYQ